MDINFYFESIDKELEILSLECDINIDRALNIDYYSNIDDIYNVSNNDTLEIITEDGNKIANGIKAAIDSIIKFIDSCVEKVKEIIASHQIKKSIKMYNSAIKKDPSLANKKITFTDHTDIAKAKDESVKKVSKSKSVFQIKKDIENLQEKITKMKPKVKAVSIGAGIALLGGLSAKMYKNSKERKSTIEQLRNSVAQASKYASKITVDVGNNSESYGEDSKTEIYDLAMEVFKYDTKAIKEASVYELSTIKSIVKNILHEMDLIQNGTKPHSTSHIDNI